MRPATCGLNNLSGGEHLDDVEVGCRKGDPAGLQGLLFHSFHRTKGGERKGVWHEIYSQSELRFLVL